MERPTVIEILDRAGKLKELHRLNCFPYRVGRSYSNDTILLDPFVSPIHIEIVQKDDGELEIVDLESENGTFLARLGTPISRQVIQSEMEISLGQTIIRFRSPSSAITPTVIQKLPLGQKQRPIERIGFSILTCLTVILWGIALSYLGYYGHSDSRRWLTEAVTLLVVTLFLILPWVGTWALISRIVRHRAFFSAHLSVCCLALLAWHIVSTLSSYASFALDATPAVSLLVSIIYFALATTAVFYHLSYAMFSSRFRTLLISFGSSFFLLGVTLIYGFSKQFDFSHDMEFPRELKPPAFKLASDQSVEQFLSGARKLEQEVAGLLKK